MNEENERKIISSLLKIGKSDNKVADNIDITYSEDDSIVNLLKDSFYEVSKGSTIIKMLGEEKTLNNNKVYNSGSLILIDEDARYIRIISEDAFANNMETLTDKLESTINIVNKKKVIMNRTHSVNRTISGITKNLSSVLSGETLYDENLNKNIYTLTTSLKKAVKTKTK